MSIETTITLTVASMAVGSLVVSLLLAAPWIGRTAKATAGRVSWDGVRAVYAVLVVVVGAGLVIHGVVQLEREASAAARNLARLQGEFHDHDRRSLDELHADLHRLGAKMDSVQAIMMYQGRETP